MKKLLRSVSGWDQGMFLGVNSAISVFTPDSKPSGDPSLSNNSLKNKLKLDSLFFFVLILTENTLVDFRRGKEAQREWERNM